MNPLDSSTELRRHLWTTDEFCRMAEVGVLAPDARVELMEGEVLDVAPSSARHSSVLMRLNHLLDAAVRPHAISAVRAPVQLSHRSQPQPDLTLLKPRADFYRNAHPSAEDVLLLI
jgi:Putative restriction endonuclease